VRPRLDRGQLIKPDGVKAAHKRIGVLDHEIRAIDRQLRDAAYRASFGSHDDGQAAWGAWCRRAEAAQTLFRSEREQLLLWLAIAEYPDFRAVYELAKTLHEQDLDPRELALIARLDKHFG
jgi:hypothetical protein